MAPILRYKVLYDSAEAGNGEWFRLDNRYDERERVVNVDLTTGDTVTIQGIVKDVRGAKPSDFFSSLEADDIATLDVLTEDTENPVLRGPWTYIRVVKEGTNGNLKVSGYI